MAKFSKAYEFTPELLASFDRQIEEAKSYTPEQARAWLEKAGILEAEKYFEGLEAKRPQKTAQDQRTTAAPRGI